MLSRKIFKMSATEIAVNQAGLPAHLKNRRAIPHGPFLREVLAKIKARGWRTGTTAAWVERRGESFFAAVPITAGTVPRWGGTALGLSVCLTPGKSARRYYVGGYRYAVNDGGFVTDRIAERRLGGLNTHPDAILDPVNAALDWWCAGTEELPVIVNSLEAFPMNHARKSKILYEAAMRNYLPGRTAFRIDRDYRESAGTTAWDLLTAAGRTITARNAPSDQLDQMLGFFKLLRGRMAERTTS